MSQNSSMDANAESREQERLVTESKLFKKFATESKELFPSRKSYKITRNERVVNCRKLKECPICHSTNKQMSRHIKTVHGLSASEGTLKGAYLVSKVRNINKGGNKNVRCSLCNASRANMRSHLIREHKIPRGSPLLKKLIPGLRKKYPTSSVPCIKTAMETYSAIHFNSMDGSCVSVKGKTALRVKQQKISSLVKMLEFICSKSGKHDIVSLVENIRVLSRRPDGYFWRPGGYATVVKEIGYFIEYLRFARRENIVPSQLVDTTVERLRMSQGNARRLAKGEHASFQDKDGKIMVLQEDIEKFKKSKRAALAQKMMNAGTPVGLRKATNIRNFVITQLLLDNHCRPSALENFSTADVEGAKKEPKWSSKGKMYYSVCSTKAKNVDSSGRPTYILLTEEMMASIEAYQKTARDTLKQQHSSKDLFLLENGDDMTSEHISKAFRSIWLAAGSGNPTFKTSANSRHFRHTANGMSKVLGSSKLRQNVHIGLNHSTEANEKSYLSVVRPIVTAETKLEMLQLRSEKSEEFAQIITGNRRIADKEGKKREGGSKCTVNTNANSKKGNRQGLKKPDHIEDKNTEISTETEACKRPKRSAIIPGRFREFVLD